MNEHQLSENLERVRANIASAARRSGRSEDSVSLVAVTKYVDADVVRALIGLGVRDLGESRPQALWEKAAAVSESTEHDLRWHFIGHLQRNKVKRTIPLTHLLHSGDSLRLLRAVDEAATRVQPVLLEVNISRDPSKHGLAADELEPLFVSIAGLERIAVRGLMAMASFEGGTDAARRDFAALRTLRDRLRPVCPPSITLDELSMGMSGDYEVAIEEGATLVRVGSTLFEPN